MKRLMMIFCTATLGFSLAGCATQKPVLQGQLSDDFGAAVSANIEAHAVAPTAAQKQNTFIPAHPARTGLAQKNYRQNTVQEPVRINQKASK